jgi:sulfoacetaldehyde dehydrogenase
MGRDDVVTLMSESDFVVAVGGVGTVRRAYTSGTPAVGAGVGNPTVIIDETADVVEAARKVHTGAGYNNGTSCSSESNALVHVDVVEQFRSELAKGGARLCTPEETARVRAVLWVNDKGLNRDLIGRPAGAIATAAGIEVDDPEKTSVLVLDCDDPHLDSPILREKLAPVLTLSTFEDFEDALDLAAVLTVRCGRGHSCAVHTADMARVARLAERVDACRLVVNQSTMTNAGSFDSGVAFSSVLSSGTWGGGSVSGNVTWRHFLNHTTITLPIPERRPKEELVFGRHWENEVEQSTFARVRVA